MAQAEYTEFIGCKVTPEMKEYFDSRYPNPSKWLRQLIEKEMEVKREQN